ncbi:MAG: helix-turn-helix transcriptional regulator [Clostridia bacterium]|nr:helix-turn-helix transcriptional regulator [Clostridia bacterium]
MHKKYRRKDGHSMDIEGLKEICYNDCAVSQLAINVLSHDAIIPKTIRAKGQYSMQRFFYIMGGSTKFELNNRTIICNKGDILYLPPDITYVSYWEKNDENAAILLQFDLFSRGKKTALSDDMFIILHDDHESYLKQFLLLANTFNQGRLGYKIQCQSIFLGILHSFITELVKTPGRQKNSAVYKGVLYIENHYMDEINVNDVAKMCSLCPTAFRAQFHEVTGMSPIQYKNYLTMKKAAELLKTGLFTASEVAAEIGINDICYFNRMFKKFYNVPPGRYKNSDNSENTVNISE